MIRVARSPEPPTFDERVRKPGQRWLAKGHEGASPGYWRRAARDLRRAFHDRCGYTAMWLSTPGTVDHLVSGDEDPSLLYEWTNFRYAAAWINSSKGALRADQILDPFEVGEGWFEIKLPSCELVMTERCPPEYRARAETMLVRLGLGRSEDVVAYRMEWYRMYLEGELTLEGLERKAPLVARAVREMRGEVDLGSGGETMRTIDDLVKGGDPVDPDLVSFLAAEGLDTLEDVQALGRPHFVQIFADRAGFTRDFVTLLEELQLTWETAPTAERLQCSPDEMEIGVGSSVVIAKLGADTFADVFRHPREVVQMAMAERDGMLLELDELLRRNHSSW